MATGSVLASTAGYAHAAADAHGVAANSPGVGSGNSVQVPVELPVNACGNTINVIGLLNPAYGNDCANVSTPSHQGTGGHGGSTAAPGSAASGTTSNSPGVASGNDVQVPVAAPVNACGNSVDVVGLGNPAFGNDCGNTGTPHHHPTTPPPHTQPPGDDCPPEQTGGDHGTPPSTPTTPGSDRTGGPNGDQPSTPAVNQPSTPGTVTQARAAAPAGQAQLASTGASGLEVLAPAGVALLLGGGVLYRRSRALARR
ncbi:chaplin [Kitasatospora sp. NPDC001540]|uniref:chaplin n=1 Tax=Kitasatospora sp. NPDC001540 TaxID=3364014 RepID=UPI0036C75B79